MSIPCKLFSDAAAAAGVARTHTDQHKHQRQRQREECSDVRREGDHEPGEMQKEEAEDGMPRQRERERKEEKGFGLF